MHVSQQAPSLAAAFTSRFGEPELTIRASDEGVPLLGAVLSYGAIVAPLQEVWLAAVARQPKRLFSRFGASVAALKNVVVPAGVEVDAGIAERFDLAVVAEGGVFAAAAKKEIVDGRRSPALRHDYGQTAWVGVATFVAARPPPPRAANDVAYERFTRHGPAALLPLKDGRRRPGVVRRQRRRSGARAERRAARRRPQHHLPSAHAAARVGLAAEERSRSA